MASQGANDNSPKLEGQIPPKCEPMDIVDAPLQASADNPSLPTVSLKTSDSPKPREALNREMYCIPSYAGWFSWSKIHTIERRALAEFFDGYSLSKTPKVYKEYREFIMNKYRENPRRVLTFTEVRKMLVGDVNLLKKVFDFLEYWGLINYHVAPENKQPLPTTTVEENLTNHCFSTSDIKQQETVAESTTMTQLESNATPTSEALPSGLQILYPGSTSGSSQAGKPALQSLDQSSRILQPTSLSPHKDALAQPATTLSMEDASDSQNLAKANDWLGDWTTQEVLRLLEAIGKFGEDWNRVATHVGTKSRAECVLRFIKLPFGDQLTSSVGATPCPTSHDGEAMENIAKVNRDIEQKENLARISPSGCNSMNENFGLDEVIDEPPSKKNRISPLADSSNPILAQVAFLSAMVGPRVAAAAAQAAVAALSEEDPISSQTLPTYSQNAHAGYKDATTSNGSLATSKDNVKSEDAEGDDAFPGKGQHIIQVPKDVEPLNGSLKDPGTHVRASIGTAMGAAASNTKLLADHEEREIEHIMSSIIENQLRKLQSKVDHYEELEFILEREHSQLEKACLQVLGDWIRYSQYHYNSGPG